MVWLRYIFVWSDVGNLYRRHTCLVCCLFSVSVKKKSWYLSTNGLVWKKKDKKAKCPINVFDESSFFWFLNFQKKARKPVSFINRMLFWNTRFSYTKLSPSDLLWLYPCLEKKSPQFRNQNLMPWFSLDFFITQFSIDICITQFSIDFFLSRMTGETDVMMT
jgi:hypothetical protein